MNRDTDVLAIYLCTLLDNHREMRGLLVGAMGGDSLPEMAAARLKLSIALNQVVQDLYSASGELRELWLHDKLLLSSGNMRNVSMYLPVTEALCSALRAEFEESMQGDQEELLH